MRNNWMDETAHEQRNDNGNTLRMYSKFYRNTQVFIRIRIKNGMLNLLRFFILVHLYVPRSSKPTSRLVYGLANTST